jgi:hypothetical protein
VEYRCYLASEILFVSRRPLGFYPSDAQRLSTGQSSPNESDEWGLVSLKIPGSEARSNIEPAHVRSAQ